MVNFLKIQTKIYYELIELQSISHGFAFEVHNHCFFFVFLMKKVSNKDLT